MFVVETVAIFSGEMIFLTAPIWGRVLGRHQATLGAAYVDDAYLMGRIEPTLMALDDTVRSFRERVCCLLVLNSVTSTPQWIQDVELRVWLGQMHYLHARHPGGTRRDDDILFVLAETTTNSSATAS
jgi:hypothetical protein